MTLVKVGDWPQLLSDAFRADRVTHSFVMGFMLAQLMYDQRHLIPIRESITLWVTMPWDSGTSRGDLLAIRIRQLERYLEDIKLVLDKFKEGRVCRNEGFIECIVYLTTNIA